MLTRAKKFEESMDWNSAFRVYDEAVVLLEQAVRDSLEKGGSAATAASESLLVVLHGCVSCLQV